MASVSASSATNAPTGDTKHLSTSSTKRVAAVESTVHNRKVQCCTVISSEIRFDTFFKETFRCQFHRILSLFSTVCHQLIVLTSHQSQNALVFCGQMNMELGNCGNVSSCSNPASLEFALLKCTCAKHPCSLSLEESEGWVYLCWLSVHQEPPNVSCTSRHYYWVQNTVNCLMCLCLF